jgi:hypothetical protein
MSWLEARREWTRRRPLPRRLRSPKPSPPPESLRHDARRAARNGPTPNEQDPREDVGRYNAVDKLVGGALLEEKLPLSDYILMVSGRSSFEIMQKSLVAGVPIVCAVSAPSSFAVALAREFKMTLIGFLREQRFNIYADSERIRVADQSAIGSCANTEIPAARSEARR